MSALLAKLRLAIAFPAMIALGACVSNHRHPPPGFLSEYPAAELHGRCADLTGVFNNVGTRLGNQTSETVPTLSSLLLALKHVPADANVTSLRILGPQGTRLEVEALSAEAEIARMSFVSTWTLRNREQFSCQGRYVVITLPSYYHGYTKGMLLYRATDGSLIVHLHEAGAIVFPVPDFSTKDDWIRFLQLRH